MFSISNLVFIPTFITRPSLIPILVLLYFCLRREEVRIVTGMIDRGWVRG